MGGSDRGREKDKGKEVEGGVVERVVKGSTEDISMAMLITKSSPLIAHSTCTGRSPQQRECFGERERPRSCPHGHL